MQHYLPGRVISIDSLKPGECAMIPVWDKLHLVFAVDLGADRLWLLDPEGTGRQGASMPVVLDTRNLGHEDCFVLEQARIVPCVALGWFAKGHHAQGGVSKALYLVGDALVMKAARDHYVSTIDLVAGRGVNVDTGRLFHATRWRVDALGPDGDYETFAEFSA